MTRLGRMDARIANLGRGVLHYERSVICTFGTGIRSGRSWSDSGGDNEAMEEKTP